MPQKPAGKHEREQKVREEASGAQAPTSAPADSPEVKSEDPGVAGDTVSIQEYLQLLADNMQEDILEAADDPKLQDELYDNYSA